MIGCLAGFLFGAEMGGSSEEKNHPAWYISYDIWYQLVEAEGLVEDSVKTANNWIAPAHYWNQPNFHIPKAGEFKT